MWTTLAPLSIFWIALCSGDSFQHIQQGRASTGFSVPSLRSPLPPSGVRFVDNPLYQATPPPYFATPQPPYSLLSTLPPALRFTTGSAAPAVAGSVNAAGYNTYFNAFPSTAGAAAAGPVQSSSLGQASSADATAVSSAAAAAAVAQQPPPPPPRSQTLTLPFSNQPPSALSPVSAPLYTEDLTDYDRLIQSMHTEKAASMFGDLTQQGVFVDNVKKYALDDDLSVDTPLLLPNNTLTYPILRRSPHGRQLLLVTTLEAFGQACWQPRCRGYLKMYLPDSLKSFHQPPTPADACVLKDIVNRGRTWMRSDVINIFKGIKASKVKKTDQYSRFRRSDVEAVSSLVKLGLYQEDFDSLISLLIVVKDFCNPRVFSEAVIKIIHARRDMGFVVPSLRSITPADYFPDFTGNGQSSAPTSGSSAAFSAPFSGPSSAPLTGLRSFSFRTTHRTFPLDNPEWQLWHFREDSKVNTMHGMWHILLSDPNADFVMARRGELFAFMHKQLVNRYNVERLGVGMSTVKAYTYEQWISPTLAGYDSRLSPEIAPGVLYYPPRLDGQRMSDENALEFRNYAAWMDRSIHAMNINNTRLGYQNGLDFGISPLADIVEPYPDLAEVGATLFHNKGHVVISELSEEGDRAGVIGFTETAMRDPAFYQWHKYTDEFFDSYKVRLGQYQEELEFPGVELTELNVFAGGKRNSLRTFVEYTNLELDENLLRTMNGTRLQYERVNHDPNIEFRLSIKSEVTEGAIGRIFMIPASQINDPEMTSSTIEIDRFYIELHPGIVTIKRRLEDSPHFSDGAPSLTELQDRMLRGMTELEFNYANCGWPLELAIPRGNKQGQKFYLVAIITQLLPGDRDSIAEWMALDQISWGWCGVREGDGSMPDTRPMGFPFDRPTTLKQIVNPSRLNAKQTPVKIFHVG